MRWLLESGTGKPAVVRTETKTYNELLSAFAQELKPKDTFEWL